MQNYIYFVFKLKPSFVERYEFTKTPENAPKVQILYCHPIEGWFLRVTNGNHLKMYCKNPMHAPRSHCTPCTLFHPPPPRPLVPPLHPLCSIILCDQSDWLRLRITVNHIYITP